MKEQNVIDSFQLNIYKQDRISCKCEKTPRHFQNITKNNNFKTIMLLNSSLKLVSSSIPLYSSYIALPSVFKRYASDSLNNILDQQIKDIKAAGTYKSERIITSPQRSSVTVSTSQEPVLNFCANNYLGLSDNQEIIDEAKKAFDTHGFGLSSVRFICGTQDIHKTLENQISQFHKLEDTILYASCFDANAGIFEALLTNEDAIISDALNHASLIDGIRLSKAEKHRYNHLDMKDLEDKLIQSQNKRLRMIVTDGAFSMDGDVAPLDKICDLADKYNAIVLIDECHATGFMGKTGRGTAEYFGVEDRVDIINSTLGKALGGATGGYTSGSKQVIDILRNKSRPYLFSNSLAPGLVGGSIKAMDLIHSDSSYRDKLANNTQRFREKITKAGFEVLGNKDHPICPIMLKDAKLASDFANDMLQKGIYVIGFSFPVVPRDQARIRVQLSASHTDEQIDKTINAFIEVGKKYKVI